MTDHQASFSPVQHIFPRGTLLGFGHSCCPLNISTAAFKTFLCPRRAETHTVKVEKIEVFSQSCFSSGCWKKALYRFSQHFDLNMSKEQELVRTISALEFKCTTQCGLVGMIRCCQKHWTCLLKTLLIPRGTCLKQSNRTIQSLHNELFFCVSLPLSTKKFLAYSSIIGQ